MVVAVFATDVVFAVDSVPAVYGITADPYLVFATNAFALLGLRALYFLLAGCAGPAGPPRLRPGRILGVIGVKLVLHWAHGVWPGVPEIPTLLSLAVIVGVLAVVTVTSLRASSVPDAARSSKPAQLWRPRVPRVRISTHRGPRHDGEENAR